MTKPSEFMGQAYGKARAAAKSIIEGYGGIYRRLAEEHGEVSALMTRIASSSDSSSRRELFDKLRKELLAHSHAEQQEFYSVLENHSETRSIASHSVAEHGEIELLLERLTTSDPSTKAWSEEFERLKQTVDHHVEEEEGKLFPQAKDVLTKDQAREIEHRFAQAKSGEMRRLS